MTAAIPADIQGREIPASWNSTRHPYPEDRCIQHLFEEQAARTPDAIAVAAREGRLTYRELNERANRLARHLKKHGVQPDSFVGISLERSLEMVVGILGILKSGGAYVPLDPAYPRERLEFMLRESKAALLLTQQKFAAQWADAPARVIAVDGDWSAIAVETAENPEGGAPQNLIYMIFTSGSTGKPKGAGVFHRGFTNLLHWFVTEFDITAEDRLLMVSSLSFDLTQKNLYAPLIRGGTLFLLPPGPYDVGLITRQIDAHGITLINCTPSAFYPLVEQPDPGVFRKLRSLRCVFLGGEPISIPRLKPWLLNEFCRAEVDNTYGPTECTDICAFYRMNRGNMDAYSFVPTGRPVFNVQLAVVDEQFRSCSAGVAGELCVAGDGVGAGYLNDPALTAAKFVANPFPEIAGHQLYRTGDLARWLPDGHIEFLGRMDHQVKLRGFRIELPEIEKTLVEHPAIREAVVAVREDRLVAYCVPKNGPVSAEELRGFLRSRLPDHMVLSAFVSLDRFPLSPNGKVDRRALPAPPAAVSSAVLQGPSAGLEREILKIWLEVLCLPHAGINDNFFDLGGNSIDLAQVHGRLEKLAGRGIPITKLFEFPTVRKLAGYLKAGSEGPSLIALQDRARRQKEALQKIRSARAAS